MKIEIELKDNGKNFYEENDDNLMYVKVLSGGNRVMLSLTKNGALGFATELLRWVHSHKFKTGSHVHITPMSKDEALTQYMGIYLAPESSELILGFVEMKETVEEIYKAINPLEK